MSGHVNRNKLYDTLLDKKIWFVVKLCDHSEPPRFVGGWEVVVNVGIHWIAKDRPEVLAELMSKRLKGVTS